MRIHKEGYGIILKAFILIAAIVLLLCCIFGWGIAAGIAIAWGVLTLLFIIRFFRCPKRVALIDEELVIAPADGKIVIVDRRFENEYLKRECIQVSIFMSIFNVHVNYYPVGGVVKYYKYHPGNYIIANHPKASEKNERTSIAVETSSGTILLFRQIAGYIARRIVCYAKEEKRANLGKTIYHGPTTPEEIREANRQDSIKRDSFRREHLRRYWEKRRADSLRMLNAQP